MPLQDDVYLADNNVVNSLGVTTGALTTGIGPIGRVVVTDFAPLTLQTANIVASTTPGANTLTVAASTGTTAKTVNGVSVVQVDVPRILRVTSGGNDSAITFNFTGFDQYGVAMTENITGSNGSVASGKKAWFSVATAAPSAAVSTTCSVGTGDVFGLPYFCANAGYILGAQWSSVLAKDTGTLVAGVTTAATKTSGDVRGTYAPSSGSSNGVSRLTITQVLSPLQIGSVATSASVMGVTQA